MFTGMYVTIDGPSSQLHGFKYWWLKSVVGYDLSVHCARCLRGSYDRRMNKTMGTGEKIALRGDLVYLCGVSPRWSTNFHAAARVAEGQSFEVDTYNGFRVRFENAERIEFPSLPDDYAGLPKAFTTCRNFQFAVHMNERMALSTSA